MYVIKNKFDIGEECYTVYRKPVHYKCPICEGNGKFLHNGYEVFCKKCNGSGKLHDSRLGVLDVCKVKVNRIRASIGENEVVIKYKVECVDEKCEKNIRNRCEQNLFKTLEEAENYCFEVNTSKIISSF